MTTLTIMETEMVLLAMLPEDERVMMIQTPRLRTIAELEDFIVDEYSRVFPFVPALSRNLRIQKCVSPELVVDRRSYATALQQAPHSFVDLAKNVQVGNVFQNMEQIYIVLNKNARKQQQAPKKVTSEAPKKATIESPRKQQVLKKITAAALSVQAKTSVESDNSAEKEVQDDKKEKEQEVSKKTSIEKKLQDTKQETARDATQDATEKIQDSKNKGNDAKKVGAADTDEKKIDLKEKSRKVAKMAKHDAKTTAKNENKSDSKTPVAGTEENISKKVVKKAAPKRSENALLKKMRAAKHDASQSGAALVVNSLQDTGSGAPKVPLKSERKRKSNEEDVLGAQVKTAPDSLEPLPKKKKKTVEKSDDNVSKPVEDEIAASMVEMSAKKTAVQNKIPKTSRKKATKSELKTDVESSTASESTPVKSKLKKNTDIKSDDIEEPVVKRAKTEAIPKVKKVADKVKRAAKPTTSIPDTSASSSSQSSSSSATQEDEQASGEKIDVVETPATKKATMVMLNEKPKVINEQKSGFEKIIADMTKQIADEKKASDAKLSTTFTPDKKSVQTSKSAESTASESSSDSEHPFVFVKVAKHSRKNATPVEDSSSSSSEEEELDYSQSLLADLTKNDNDEEEVVPVVLKKGKKSKQSNSTVQTSHSMEEDMPSSQLTQKSQELNSVLLSPLSRNRFSLGSMPVKVKGETSNATDRPNSRPRK
ncbi:unnamed protein product [Peronospora farinosa]|uniref:Uncharacterized protein n=1 Tax=Peronospora farinosa TaxID=134698 RepID=A0AAV0SYV8_9STRA|nr:unnamed protein product [Peronospora farinosa]